MRSPWEKQIRYRNVVSTGSLIVGPLLLSIGDSFHPAESLDPDLQVAIIAGSSSLWYGAHLMIFLGLLAFIPGIIAIGDLVSEKRPGLGFIVRNMMLIGAAAFSAVLVFEMLLGRFVAEGAGPEQATKLLEAFATPGILGIVLPIIIVALFGGVWLMTWALFVTQPGYRWPASLLSVGVFLILIEIFSGEVLFSQVGNVALLVGGIGFALKIHRHSQDSQATQRRQNQ